MGDGSSGGEGRRVTGSRLLFVMLAAAIVFAPIARGAVSIWSVTPVLLVIYSVVFLLLIRWVWSLGTVPISEKTRRRGQSLAIPIALLAIIATTSFAFSIYQHDSFYALLRLFAYIGLYYAVANEFGHRMRKRLIWVTVSVGAGLSAYGILQYFGVFKHAWWYPQTFLAASYVNHNHFAGYLELAMPVAVAILVMRWAKRSVAFKLALATGVVLMTAAFILSQSRGAWVSLALASAVIVLFVARKGTARGARLLIAVAIITSLALLAYFGREIISERLSTITEARQGDDMSGGRLKIWQGAAGMIRERPLIGVGIGDFDHGFYRYRPEGFNARAVYAHNDYVQAAAEMGVLAPLIMIWLFAATVRAGLRNRDNPYALGCSIGVLSLALHGLVDFNFHILANMVVFVVWIAVIAGESNAERA